MIEANKELKMIRENGTYESLRRCKTFILEVFKEKKVQHIENKMMCIKNIYLCKTFKN